MREMKSKLKRKRETKEDENWGERESRYQNDETKRRIREEELESQQRGEGDKKRVWRRRRKKRD